MPASFPGSRREQLPVQRNSEPLSRSVAGGLEGSQLLALLHVPDAERPVVAAREQTPAIRREEKRRGQRRMPLERPDCLAGGCVDQANRAVKLAQRHHLAVRGQSEALERLRPRVLVAANDL